ncbi:MAG: hypothetical protein WA722_18180 [Candidatus Sulfotelmatobacter sp.]
MLDDAITNQWLWFSAAGLVFAVLVGVFTVRSLYKSKPRRAARDQQGKDGWTPTGRIDFVDGGSDNFILQAEDTQTVDSTGGVEHRQIRWRKATLDEARAVVAAYHARLNLTMTGIFTVRSLKSYTANSDLENKQQEPAMVKDEAANGMPRG